MDEKTSSKFLLHLNNKGIVKKVTLLEEDEGMNPQQNENENETYVMLYDAQEFK